MDLNLTDKERDRFSTWLKMEAKTDKGIIEQMGKINTPEFIVKRYKSEMAAKLIVARLIENTETMTL